MCKTMHKFTELYKIVHLYRFTILSQLGKTLHDFTQLYRTNLSKLYKTSQNYTNSSKLCTTLQHFTIHYTTLQYNITTIKKIWTSTELYDEQSTKLYNTFTILSHNFTNVQKLVQHFTNFYKPLQHLQYITTHYKPIHHISNTSQHTNV